MGYTRLLLVSLNTPARTLAPGPLLRLSAAALSAKTRLRSLIWFQTCGVWRWARTTYREFLLLSRSVSSLASLPRMGARRAAACCGASGALLSCGVNIFGSAVMSYASTLVARATPLRSVISPRSAASLTLV